MTTVTSAVGRSANRFAYVPVVHGAMNAGPDKAAAALDLGPLAAIATTVSIGPGKAIVQEGDAAAHLFRITSGVVKVYRTLPDGRCQITGFLFAGDFVGLTFEDTYVSGVVAVGPVTVARFPRRKVEQLVEVSPLVSRLLFRRACSELMAAQDQMLLLGRKTATEKVASFLVAMARRATDDVVDLKMTRADIADYLGLTIETVSRILGKFDDDGVIAVNRAHIRIVLPDALEDLAEGA